MRAVGFTGRQRHALLLLALFVAAVLAVLAGFIITSLQNFERASAIGTPLAAHVTKETAPSPTPLPTATATPAATPMPEEGIWSQVRGARLFDQVARQMEMVRGLTPLRGVALNFVDEAEMDSLLRKLHAERDLESEHLPYIVLGILPERSLDFDIRAPAAVYVPEEEQVYVDTSRPMGDASAQTVLAWAYVRALQDQHFGLEMIDARTRTIDERLAAQALIAGDAAVSTGLYCHRDLASADWERLTELAIEAEHIGLNDGPGDHEAWRRLQRFPSVEGRAFVQELFEAGGWDAVNRAYTDLPRSTAQILHPARYMEQQGRPNLTVVPDMSEVLGQGWELVLEDTLGELVVGLYLTQVLPEGRSRDAAEGWDGDTFVVWAREDGERVLIWRTRWESSVDARVFEDALGAAVTEKYSLAEPMSPGEGAAGRWWESEAGGFHISRTGLSVLFVRAPDATTAANAVGAMR